MEKQSNREISVYCYYDREAKAYDVPFHAFSDLHAVRKFKIDADKKESALGKFTKEFDLYRLGKFDMFEGKHTIKPELIMEGYKIEKMKEVA